MAVSSNIVATFSQQMDPATITASTFSLKSSAGVAVQGAISVPSVPISATFTPSVNLAYGTTYTATITTGVKAATGTALTANYSWSFTTAAPPAVTVSSTAPVKGATSVPVNQSITAAFGQAMNASTITTSTFQLKSSGGMPVAGTVAYSATGSVATFTPSVTLAYSATYTATITTGVKSSAGGALASTYSWTFTTVQAPTPKVVSTTPASGATAVPIGSALVATFSQPMNAATIMATTFTVATPAQVLVKGSIKLDSTGMVAAFQPSTNLACSTAYTATLSTSVKSVAGIALASSNKWTFTTEASPLNAAYVDFGSAVQTIRGFGGSTAWITNLTAAQANTLFGTGAQQIGLSILRVRIDPGGQANWGEELNNAQLASARGASVMATPWTPPAAMKSNNSTIMGSLKASSYGDYAKYLESFVSYMKTGGVSLTAISLQNEPDAVVTYESCVWTPQQIDTWVANNSSVLTAKLMIPESESFTKGFSDPALNDSNAVDRIGIVGGHLYGVSPSSYPLAASKGKDAWMTEHYLTGSGISGALALAKEVHDSMTVANYNAYIWWWIVNWTAGSYPYGLMDESGKLTQNGYALGQFSRFVRPGYVRSNATYNPNPQVYVSAYKGNGHFVIVAINQGKTAVDQPFTIQNQSLTALTPYQTTASANMKQLTQFLVSSGTFTYSLPAQSITTLVQ